MWMYLVCIRDFGVRGLWRDRLRGFFCCRFVVLGVSVNTTLRRKDISNDLRKTVVAAHQSIILKRVMRPFPNNLDSIILK